MIGRRVATIAEIELEGDYCGPISGYTGPQPAIFFLLPGSRAGNAVAGQRAIHHVVTPPHVFRECADGSVEIRESIGAMPYWHGYLDEGHIWRGVGEWA